ncbi:MAG: hypothetical protein ABI618_20785, partial [Nitrospirota bacterium]
AKTPSFLLAVSLEDLLGDTDTPNIPGAPARDYPVWRMKAGPQGSGLHEWRDSPDIANLVKVINRERTRPPSAKAKRSKTIRSQARRS